MVTHCVWPVSIRGGPTRSTFSNQGLITKELIITSSLVSIEIPIEYTFEFFLTASPNDIMPRLCSDDLHPS